MISTYYNKGTKSKYAYANFKDTMECLMLGFSCVKTYVSPATDFLKHSTLVPLQAPLAVPNGAGRPNIFKRKAAYIISEAHKEYKPRKCRCGAFMKGGHNCVLR